MTLRLTQAAEADWDLLSTLVDFSASFWLGFLFLKSPPAGALFLQRLQAHPALPHPVQTYRATNPEEIAEALPWIVTAAPADATLWCAVEGLETPERRAAFGQSFMIWNERREVIRRARRAGLLFVMPWWCKPLVRDLAPDLWSIRNIVLEPDTLAPQPQPAAAPALEPFTPPLPPASDAERRLATRQWARTKDSTDWRPLADALHALVQAQEYAQARDAADHLLQRLPAPDALQTQPDPPRVAHDLAQLSADLEALGRDEDALPLQELACAISRAHDLDRGATLARRLLALGRLRHRLGREAEGLEATLEAADLYRQLAQLRQDLSTYGLAKSLNDMGNWLSVLGHREEALETAREVVKLYRQLAQQQPDLTYHLTNSLNMLGSMLRESGHYEEALEVLQEAVSLRRNLARRQPETFLFSLTRSLHHLGTNLGELRRHEEALEAIREAVQTLLPFYQESSSALHDETLESCLQTYQRALEALGRDPEADVVMQEARRALGADV